jgi:hypothetical protein
MLSNSLRYESVVLVRLGGVMNTICLFKSRSGRVLNQEANRLRLIPFSITNKMHRYTIFFIAVNAVRVSGGFSAHHQELKLYTQHLVYAVSRVRSLFDKVNQNATRMCTTKGEFD